VYAAELFEVELPQENKRFYAFVETDGCFADGVSVATGCWSGRRTMRLMDYGRVAVTIVDTESEHAIRFWPHPQARCRAVTYAPDAQSRWHAQLAVYQIMPTAELLCAAPVALTVSLAALISRPGVRAMCEQCGEEILNEREVLVDGHTLCRSCAGDSYYQSQTGSVICTAHHELMITNTN
jgi:formylmethanofuran dehydrogenase subunit E